MNFYLFSIVIITCLGHVLTDCPNVPLYDFNQFNFDNYLGRWYQVAARPAFDNERSLKCFYADISRINSTAYSIIYRANDIITNAGSELDTYLIKNNNEYEYYLSFFLQPTKKGRYGVFDTDYNNYAIVYSCDPSTGVQRFYINSRTRGSSAYNNQLVLNALSRLQHYGIKTDYVVYSLITDKNC